MVRFEKFEKKHHEYEKESIECYEKEQQRLQKIISEYGVNMNTF